MIIPESAQLTLVVTPILLHLDKELEKYLLAQELLHVLSCLLSNTLQSLALVTNDDTLLRVAGYINGGRNAVDGRLLFVGVDLDLATIRDLLLV